MRTHRSDKSAQTPGGSYPLCASDHNYPYVRIDRRTAAQGGAWPISPGYDDRACFLPPTACEDPAVHARRAARVHRRARRFPGRVPVFGIRHGPHTPVVGPRCGGRYGALGGRSGAAFHGGTARGNGTRTARTGPGDRPVPVPRRAAHRLCHRGCPARGRGRRAGRPGARRARVPYWLELFAGVPCWTPSGQLVRIADEGGSRVLALGERPLTGPQLHVRAAFDVSDEDVLVAAVGVPSCPGAPG